MKFVHSELKGRGVIADEDFKKGAYVLEYKYNDSFTLKERKDREAEYATNEEGCYILDVQLPEGKGWLCLDATRNLNCWGRYLNHSITPNLKMFTALMIRGKWRVGFYALRDIKKGAELVYDYGEQKKPPAWLQRRPPKIKVHTSCVVKLLLAHSLHIIICTYEANHTSTQ